MVMVELILLVRLTFIDEYHLLVEDEDAALILADYQQV